jgi:hypothetical protein
VQNIWIPCGQKGYGCVLPPLSAVLSLSAYNRDLISLIQSLANLHITTGGHGYAGLDHTDHSCEFAVSSLSDFAHIPPVMNLSHVITEFSFGPYFPDITQPLDYSFEVAQDRRLPVIAFCGFF